MRMPARPLCAYVRWALFVWQHCPLGRPEKRFSGLAALLFAQLHFINFLQLCCKKQSLFDKYTWYLVIYCYNITQISRVQYYRKCKYIP
jgi:hypothetical protein